MARTAQLSVVETLSPAREALTRINAEIAELRLSIAAANEPVVKLIAVAVRLADAEQKLAASRGEDDERRASWLAADRDGPRPEPSDQTLRYEIELVEARRDHVAAERALPVRQEEAQRLNERLGALALQQRAVVYNVVLEAVRDFCETELRPVIAEFLRRENALRGVADILWQEGRRNGSASLSVAAQVSAAIEACRPDKTNPNQKPGERLLRELMSDAGARLELE